MNVRATDLANPEWLAATLRRHHRQLGLPLPPVRVDLLDVRIKHPHRPESIRCRGWATVRAPTRGEGGHDEPVFLIRTEGTGPLEATGTPIPGLPLRVWRFPDDPALPTLKLFVDPQRVRAVVPGDLAAGHVVEDVQVVRWQPGESATVRCDLVGTDGRSAVYAKLLAHDGLLAVDAAQRLLHAQLPAGLGVAEPLGVDAVHRILWTREVVGRPLLTGPGGAPGWLLPAAGQVGRWLAALHRSGLALPDRVVDPADIAAEAAKKGRKITQVQPRFGEVVQQLTALAAYLHGTSPSPRHPLHGDFHLDQMLLSEHDLVILDLDEMVTGDPALDLAELAVDLGLRRLPSEVTGRFLRSVAEAYEDAGGTPPAPAVLRGYAAAELLNRCYRHLRRPVPGWRQALGGDLAAADEVLAGAVSATRSTRAEERT